MITFLQYVGCDSWLPIIPSLYLCQIMQDVGFSSLFFIFFLFPQTNSLFKTEFHYYLVHSANIRWYSCIKCLIFFIVNVFARSEVATKLVRNGRALVVQYFEVFAVSFRSWSKIKLRIYMMFRKNMLIFICKNIWSVDLFVMGCCIIHGKKYHCFKVSCI